MLPHAQTSGCSKDETIPGHANFLNFCMIKKIRDLFGWLTLAIAITSSLAAKGITLQDALATAYKTNPTLLAARAQLRSKDEDIAQAASHWRPTAQINVTRSERSDVVTGGTPGQNQIFSSQFPALSYEFEVTEPIYRGGRTEAELDAALAGIRAQRASLISTEEKTLLDVATDYCDVVRDDAGVDLQLHNEEYLAKKLEATRAQYSGGELSKTDVAQAEAAYQQARAQRFAAESTAVESRQHYLRDVGSDPGQVSYPSANLPIPMTAEESAHVASIQNPDVLAAQFTVEYARATESDTEDQALPQLNLVGTAQHQDGASFKKERENLLGVSLRLTIPVYSGGAVESMTRAAEQTIEMDSQQVEVQRAIATSTAFANWSKVHADNLSIDAYKNQVSANGIALEGVEHQQASGEKTLLDVLNANQALLQSQLNLNSGTHDEVVAQYTLNQATGMLTAQNLKLPVEYYDPVQNFDSIKDRWFGFGISK